MIITYNSFNQKLCWCLVDNNPDVRNNCILALRILSDLPSGFLRIVEILYDKVYLLDEVFGCRATFGLCELLPKLSKYKNPPVIDIEMLPRYSVRIDCYVTIQKYIRGIIYFIKNYREEAVEVIIHDTCNFAQKLGPFFILNDNTIHKQAKYILNKICSKDTHNKQLLHNFIEKYSSNEINYKNISKDNSESLHLSDFA